MPAKTNMLCALCRLVNVHKGRVAVPVHFGSGGERGREEAGDEAGRAEPPRRLQPRRKPGTEGSGGGLGPIERWRGPVSGTSLGSILKP